MKAVCLLCILGVFACGDASAQQAPAQPPRFKSSVEVTSIDVAVVDGQGKPLPNLVPADFTVRVDGKARSVVSAEWVPLAATATDAKPIARVPEGYSSNENATGGRLIAIAVDEPHIRPGGAAAVLAAATAFIGRLSPSDRVAAVSLGVGGPATPFISDRQRVTEAIGRMAGQRETMKISAYSVAPTEALEIADGNRSTADQVSARECAGLRGAPLQQCRQEVETEALFLADQLKRASNMTVQGLRDLLNGMRVLDGPKTLILLSEGFSLPDTGVTNELASLAAATRTSIYTMRLDNQLFEITNSRAAITQPLSNRIRDDGLESLAAATRGALYIVSGTGSQLFASIEAELSGYYLLGVESDPGDHDGKQHAIRIDVSRRGATVRTRRQLLNVPADLNRPRTPRDRVNASLTEPLLLSALPLRITTFALRGPEQSKVQLLIRAEVGTDYTASRPVWVGYVIQDRSGRVIDSRTVRMTLAPVVNGVPGSLQYSGGASLDPGEYTIKLAVSEGDRMGSVDHPVHASLVEAGDVKLSDLMVGGPSDITEILRPTVGYTVSYGSVHGYLEAYGARLERIGAKYEIAAALDGPALMAADVTGRSAGADRVLFTQVISVGKIPPGEYVLRATVTSNGQPVKTLARRFEIAPPSVLMTSAAGAAPASVPGGSADLFLPVEEGALSRPFGRDEALRPQTVDPFLQRVPMGTRPMFEQGLAELQKGNWAAAEVSFKRAIRPDVDSTSALSYLAALFAATGRDAEAAAAWQTALIDGSDVPQIYEWLGDTLARAHDYTAARSILEEAVGRWPSDTRFGRTLALSYATLGRGRDAIRTLDRYIGDGHPEPDLLFLMVEWLFQVHNNRAVVINGAADLTMARNYAAQYAKADGPKQPLVQQWVDFLANEKR